MKLELLPNEILLECFKFLDILEIFHSFDQLNSRFSHLIRNIPLHLHFQHVRKSIFDQFCTQILSIPEITHQIHSLHLSNKETCGQIDAFLSSLSLHLFSHLHCLTLTEVEKTNTENLTFMLSLIPQLSSFHLIAPKSGENRIIAALPKSNLRILSIPTLWPILPFIHQISSITNLTISGCSLNQLSHQLFRFTPMLKYLNVEYVSEYYNSTKIDSSIDNSHAIHLQQMIIMNFEYIFEEFAMLVKQTPNLLNLTIHGNYDIDMIDAYRWEHLITSSLLDLQIFKFNFSYTRTYDDDYIIYKCQQFQSSFWQEQHQWYTEYSLSRYSTVIYTIPYMSNSYKLEANIRRYFSELINTSVTFDNVTHLTLSHEEIKKECQHYFSNVTSINIIVPERYYNPSLGGQQIRALKRMVNLSKLKHFGIAPICGIKGSGVILELLYKAPLLSSMAINSRSLNAFAHDTEFNQYLNKVIKKLDLYQYRFSSFKTSYEIENFCKHFSGLEQLTCNIDRSDELLFLLNHLEKLSTLKVYLSSINDHEYFSYWFKNATRKFKCLFDLKYIDKYETELSVWIDRNKD